MTIIRVDKRAGRWEAVPVSLIEDDRLGFDTRGFAAWLLSKPDGWQIRASALPYLLKDRTLTDGHVGRTRARRYVRELERAGYLVRTRTRSVDGRWHWTSTFEAVPTIDRFPVDGSSDDGSSAGGSRGDKEQTTNKNRLNQITKDTYQGFSSENLSIRTPFSAREWTDIRRLLDPCPESRRQEVIDEVVGIYERGELRGSHLGLLRTLAKRAEDGRFIPKHGKKYSALPDDTMKPARAVARSTTSGTFASGEHIAASAIQALGRLKPRES